MDVKGLHLVADLSQCQAIHDYDREEALEALLLLCAEAANATSLGVKVHKFEPAGISGIVFLAESHISAHLWPEAGFVSLDCYTCGHVADPWQAIEMFINKIKPLYHSITEVRRGVPHIYIENAYTLEAEELGFVAIDSTLELTQH